MSKRKCEWCGTMVERDTNHSHPLQPTKVDDTTDQILCDLHDLGFHGKDLTHLVRLATYIEQECKKSYDVGYESAKMIYADRGHDTYGAGA